MKESLVFTCRLEHNLFKKVALSCVQILLGKWCFQPELRKTSCISLCSQVSRKTSGLNEFLALSYGSKHNVVKIFGFGLLADSFSKRFFDELNC